MASEASHRLHGFDLHKEHPNVVRLVVHLKGRQTILFQEGTNATAVLNQNPHTTLTAWFAFNKTAREHLNPSTPLRFALNTLYHDFPRIATWKRRKSNGHSTHRCQVCCLSTACNLCNPPRGRGTSCVFCYITCLGLCFLRTSHAPIGTCNIPHNMHLSKKHVSSMVCCRTMLSGPSAWRRLQAWPVPHALGHCLLPCWCSMLLQTHWLCGSASMRTWQKTSCIKHARLVLNSTRVWLCMSTCLAALHGHGLHVMRRSMLTMLCVCSYNVQGEPTQQLDAAIRDMVLQELAL